MEIFGLLGMLTFFATITGYVVIFRWFKNGGSVRQKIAKDIQELGHRDAYASQAEIFKAISDYVNTGTLPPVAPIHHVVHAQPEVHPVAPQTHQPTQVTHEEVAPIIEAPKSGLNLDLGTAFQHMDNINMMLYLGAFLIIVAASIFIGFNYESFDGFFKTVSLAVFAIAFYGSGIALYLTKPKLRPAGSTFTAIGLILTPIVGLAAYSFIFNNTHGNEVWFTTSVVCLALYALSVVLLRKVYVAYFMAFATLSMVESGISMVSLPVYYLAWGMAFCSIVMLVIARKRGIWTDIADSFSVSAQIIMPTSLIFSVMLIGEQGLTQTAITVLLSAAFYGAMCYLTPKQDEKVSYYGLALALVPTGVLLWMAGHDATMTQMGIVLAGICITYTLVAELANHYFGDIRTEITTLIGGVAGLAGAIFVANLASIQAIVLIITIASGTYAHWRYKFATGSVIAISAFLWLPLVLFQKLWSLEETSLILSFLYLVIAVILTGLRWLVREWGENHVNVARLGYILAMIASFSLAYGSEKIAYAVIALALAALTVLISYIESAPLLVVITAFLVYFAGYEIYDISSIHLLELPFLVTGVLLYIVSFAVPDDERRQVVRISGIAGPYMAAFTENYQSVWAIGSLALAAVLTYTEAIMRKSKLGQYLGVAVGVVALNWVYLHLELTNTQYFTVTWAFYFGWLAWQYHKEGNEGTRDLLTAISLGVLTVPLAGQALGLDGGWYGLALIFEALTLVLAGMSINYPLVRNWGAVVLVCEVLYQLRAFILSIPWYVIFALIGLGLLGLAMYQLQRRKD